MSLSSSSSGAEWGKVAPWSHPDPPIWCSVSGHDSNRVCSVSTEEVCTVCASDSSVLDVCMG